MLRPLILMTEAPKKDDAEADPAADDDKKVTTADDPPADDPPADDPPADDAEGDDTGAADDGADLEDDEDDEDDLGGGDASDNSLDAGETQSDPVQEQLRRERLYDAIAARPLAGAPTVVMAYLLYPRARLTEPVARFIQRARSVS